MDGPILVLSLLVTWLTFVGWLFLGATVRSTPVTPLPREDAPPSAEPLWVSDRGWAGYVDAGIAALAAHLRAEPPV